MATHLTRSRVLGTALTASLALAFASPPGASAAEKGHRAKAVKPSPDAVLAMLEAGNQRFYTGKPTYPHTSRARLRQAGTQDQGDYAYATVITCS